MAITHLTQLEITNSSNEDDTLLDSSTNVSADSLEKDLNYIRSVLKNIIGNGNWYDFSNTKKLIDITSFVNSISTGSNYINANKIDFSTSVVTNPDAYPAVLRGSSDWIKISNFIPGINSNNKLLWAYISYTTTDIDTAIQNTPTILNLQASTGGNNTSLQNQINSLNTTVTNHENRITSLENDVTSTANPVSIVNRISTAETNITTLFNNLATTNGNVTILQGQVSTISTNISNLSAQIGTFTQTQYNSDITSLNSSVSSLSMLVPSLHSYVNTLEQEINIILIPSRDKTLGRNSFILDFKNYNYFDTSLLQNNNFNTILFNFISLLTATYLVDIIYFQFPLDKLTTTEINNLNQSLTQLKTTIYQNLNKKIKIGIYIDLYKVFSDTTYNAFSTASNNFTQKISSIFTNTNFVYIDALLLGPLDAIEYYTFDTNTSTYTFTQITNTLKFVDSVFSNSIKFLENKNVPVILAFKDPDFLLNNFTRITSISSSRKYLIPSTYIYTLNNVDYPYNLETLGAEIYYLDALVDPSECGTTYSSPYDYSYICAYTDPARYTTLNTATPPLIDGSFTSNVPTDQFLYTVNSLKLKNKNLFNSVGITNPAVTNNKVLTKSAAIVLKYDTTNSSSPAYELLENVYKRYQLDPVKWPYTSLIEEKEFVESSGPPSLFNPHIEIAPSQSLLKPFISYSYDNIPYGYGVELLIGIDFTNEFSISLLNNGLFNKESTYTNVFTATLASGTLTITLGANTATINSISPGFHLLRATLLPTYDAYFTLDVPGITSYLPLNASINSNKYLIKIQNNSTTQSLYVSNIIYYRIPIS